jgi:probable FeS assembly SUF system protein SufT
MNNVTGATMQHQREVIMSQRECIARLVPVGTEIIIPSGTAVTITQALGGSFTVLINGNLARIDEQDADVLGKAAKPTLDELRYAKDTLSEEDVYKVMRTVYDPEIPVNIVDLGLIYDVACHRVGSGYRVHVQMTLTAPGCGMGQVITDEVKHKLMCLPQIDQANVDLVFTPPWSSFMLTEEAKLELGLL